MKLYLIFILFSFDPDIDSTYDAEQGGKENTVERGIHALAV